MKKIMCILALALTSCIHASAQAVQEDSPETLRKYVPLLPEVKAQMWKIDPTLGYAVKSVGGGVSVLSDNGWQSYLLETSIPGVFAVGDVRSGSVKRVASGVDEGSLAISFVHQVLGE